MKQMQSLCYEGTHKETKRLAVKSKGVVQVFRMFCLDGCLPKDCSLDKGGHFYTKVKVGNCVRGV